jgi:hypothetical protein
MTGRRPGSREYLFSLGNQNAGIGVEGCGQRPGPGDLRLDMKYILGKIHSLLTNLRRDILRAAKTGVAPLHKLLNIR